MDKTLKLVISAVTILCLSIFFAASAFSKPYSRQEMIEKSCAQFGLETLSPLRGALPPEFTYEEIRLVVARLRWQRDQAWERWQRLNELTEGFGHGTHLPCLNEMKGAAISPSGARKKRCGNLDRMVGASGFEPEASCAQGRRATRLRYAPTYCAEQF